MSAISERMKKFLEAKKSNAATATTAETDNTKTEDVPVPEKKSATLSMQDRIAKMREAMSNKAKAENKPAEKTEEVKTENEEKKPVEKEVVVVEQENQPKPDLDKVVESMDKSFDEAKVETSVDADKAEASDETEEPEAETAEVVEEKPKKRTRRTKKSAEPVAQDKEEASAAESAPANNAQPALNYEDSIIAITADFEDERWISYRDDLLKALDRIQINADMNPGTLQVALMETNDVYSMLVPELAHNEGLLEALTNERDGICTAINAEGRRTGSNEEARKANGLAALKNYVSPEGNRINYIDVLGTLRYRVGFLKAIERRIKAIQSVAVTISGAMKINHSLEASTY